MTYLLRGTLTYLTMLFLFSHHLNYMNTYQFWRHLWASENLVYPVVNPTEQVRAVLFRPWGKILECHSLIYTKLKIMNKHGKKKCMIYRYIKSVAYKRQFSSLFRCTNSNCFQEQELMWTSFSIYCNTR